MDFQRARDELYRLYVSIPPQYHLPAILFVAVLAVTMTFRSRSRSQLPKQTSPVPPPQSKKQTREYGRWTPSNYTLPLPAPYPDWSLTETKPLPYRPFRYGPKYHVTMGLRTVAPDEWIELDNHFPRYHADKARRIRERADKCCITAPEAYPAAVELLEELARYLPARYPSLFQLYHHRTSSPTSPSGTTEGKEKEKETIILKNLFSNEEFTISPSPKEANNEDPITTCARLIQDDIAIMMERPDGQYYLLSGAILLPGFWRLEDKFGMPLSEIHTSGDVPQFREKLEKGMMNFFRRVKPEEMVARNNYFLQVDDDLAWSWSIGPEDGDDGSGGKIKGWNAAEKNRAVEHHMFRSERQTLRRLPRSGGVVFTIRTYFHPVTEIAEEDYVPGRLASAVRSWGEDVSRYKGKERYGEVLLEYLDRKHEEQVRRGLDLGREEEDGGRGYPY